MILNRQKKFAVDTRRAARFLKRLLRHLGYDGREVNVVYLDDAGIREFNRTYLNKNRATNVLSFPITDEGPSKLFDPGILGDILISVERASKAAARARLSLDDILDYFMIHGLLHLIGYDHERSRTSARRMMEKEEELFFLLHNYEIHSRLVT